MMGKLNDLLTSIISKVNASVKTEAQTLTDEQKAQARQNIGAAAEGGGGGVQPDWNQNDESQPDFIKNKPFGEMPTGGDTLTWDGNTEGLESFTLVNSYFVKVSETVLSESDFANGISVGFAAIHTNEKFTITDAPIQFLDEGVTVIGNIGSDMYCLSMTPEVAEADFGVSGGTYFTYFENEAYVSSLTIPGYTEFPVMKKIEEKYLPSATFLYIDAENYLYTASDTSDTSKRITMAELRDVVNRGRNIYVYALNATSVVYMSINSIAFYPELGYSTVIVFVGNTEYIYYTAEYVPETT